MLHMVNPNQEPKINVAELEVHGEKIVEEEKEGDGKELTAMPSEKVEKKVKGPFDNKEVCTTRYFPLTT